MVACAHNIYPNLEICRAADILVKQHGADVPFDAAMRADEMLEKGDLDGCQKNYRVLALFT